MSPQFLRPIVIPWDDETVGGVEVAVELLVAQHAPFDVVKSSLA